MNTYTKLLDPLKKELNKQENLKEEALKQSREITKEAKKAIFALHRQEIKEAKKIIETNKKQLQLLTKKYEKTKWHYLLNDAYEEHAESIIFYNYIEKETFTVQNEIPAQNYIAGLSDAVGELVRYAYKLFSEKKYQNIKKLKTDIDNLYATLLDFEIKGETRKKFDAIKYHMQKIDDLIFEIDKRV